MDFLSLLNAVATLAVILAIGFGSRKTGLIDDAFSKKLSEFIIKLGQPLLIISALISIEFTRENLLRGINCTILSFILHTLVGAVALLASRFFKGINVRKISAFAMIFANCGFIGLPILQSIFGEDGLFCGAFYLIGFHIFVWTIGMFILSRQRPDIKFTPMKMLFNHGTVPCYIGIILFLLPIEMPPFVKTTAGYYAELCTPISVMITGALIAKSSLRELFGDVRVYVVSCLKLLVIPTITAVVLRLMGLDTFYIVFGTVMTALPSGAIVTMFGELYDIDPKYASRIVGTTSVLCILTLPVLVALAGLIASL